MPLPEQVVADYQTMRLSLKGHPMEFLRAMFAKERVVACNEVSHRNDRRRVRCAGVVLVRQRPGSAKGVVFMTLEDETGIANIVVWPKVMEQYRKEVMGARLILVEGYIQSSPEQVTHLVAQRMFDRSGDLIGLANDAFIRKHAVPAGPALIEPLQRRGSLTTAQRRPPRPSRCARAENPPPAQRPHPAAVTGFSLNCLLLRKPNSNRRQRLTMKALMARRNTRLPAMMAKNNLSKRSTPEAHDFRSRLKDFGCVDNGAHVRPSSGKSPGLKAAKRLLCRRHRDAERPSAQEFHAVGPAAAPDHFAGLALRTFRHHRHHEVVPDVDRRHRS